MAPEKTRRFNRPLHSAHSALAENLRILRLDANLTQDELAQRAGLERKTVNRIENNKLSPTIDTLVRIALVLRTSVSELIDGA